MPARLTSPKLLHKLASFFALDGGGDYYTDNLQPVMKKKEICTPRLQMGAAHIMGEDPGSHISHTNVILSGVITAIVLASSKILWDSLLTHYQTNIQITEILSVKR